MNKNPFSPFYVRLRPTARQLLDAAADAEFKSRAQILDELITKHLAQFRTVSDRLDQMLGSQK